MSIVVRMQVAFGRVRRETLSVRKEISLGIGATQGMERFRISLVGAIRIQWK